MNEKTHSFMDSLESVKDGTRVERIQIYNAFREGFDKIYFKIDLSQATSFLINNEQFINRLLSEVSSS